jgi:myosin heavy subunit
MGWVEKQTLEGMEYYYNADTEAVSWDKPDALKTDDEKAHASGEWVWIPHATKVWQAGRKIKEKEDGTTKFKTLDDESVYFKVPAAEKKGYFVLKGTITDNRKQKVPVPLWSLNPSSLKFAEEDLVGLDDMNDALISHNLRMRYQKDELYTWVGASRHVLVSINPYKKLPLYTDAMIDMYHTRPPNKHLAPHVYDIAQDSFHTMMFESHNQAVLISGESGAGKTEATKQCLGFLAKVAGSDSGVEDKILVCNPLLEAFGNAKTIRNINSSR